MVGIHLGIVLSWVNTCRKFWKRVVTFRGPSLTMSTYPTIPTGLKTLRAFLGIFPVWEENNCSSHFQGIQGSMRAALGEPPWVPWVLCPPFWTARTRTGV